jgi:hypothetical protein
VNFATAYPPTIVNVPCPSCAALRAEVERLEREMDSLAAGYRLMHARADRYRKAIEDAPHAYKCSYSHVGRYPCDCWKSAVLAGAEAALRAEVEVAAAHYERMARALAAFVSALEGLRKKRDDALCRPGEEEKP